MDDGPRPITDEDELASVRSQARGVLLRSLAATFVVMVVWGVIRGLR